MAEATPFLTSERVSSKRVARFEAVVFDMDGVLIDSEPLHYAASNQVLAASGGIERDEYETFIGTTLQFFWDTLIPRRGLTETRAFYEDQYETTVLRILATPLPAAPGATELVARLRELGVRLALASSSRRSWIDATLAAIGLTGAFEVLVSGDDVEHGKPEPDIYLLAAARLGVPAERCLAIEDSPNGVMSASRAGMQVLGVRTPYTAHLTLVGATRVVDSLTDLDLRGDPFADF